MAKKAKSVIQEVEHRAFCNTEDKALGQWTDEESAEKDAERHLIKKPDHDVDIVTKQTSTKAFSI